MSSNEPIVVDLPQEDQESDIHVCNSAAELIPTYRVIGESYEDRDLDAMYAAEDEFAFLSLHTPGAFVLIRTGDYIIPKECLGETLDGSTGRQWGYRPYHDCETYDALYQMLLVPRAVWEQCKAEVLKADRLWRTEKSYCFDWLRNMDYWWWLDTNDYPFGSEANHA